MSAIAFLAGMGAGYLDQNEASRRAAIEAARERRQQEEHDANKRVRDAQMRELQLQEAAAKKVREAAAPLPITEDTLAGPVQEDAAPMPTVYKVGARTFAERGLAEQAATDQQARQARVQAAYDETDPSKGQQFRAASTQASLHEALAKAQVQALVREGVVASLSAAAGGADAKTIEGIYNANGTTKISNVVVEPYTIDDPVLGKVQTARMQGQLDNGQVVNFGDVRKSSLMLMDAAKRLGIETQLAHVGIAKQQANTQEQYRIDQAENMRQQRLLQARQLDLESKKIDALIAKQGKPGGPIQITLKDKRDFESDLSGYIKDQFPVKDGSDQKERDAVAQSANKVRAAGSTLFETNASLGIPVTAGTAIEAMKLASDKKNVRIMQVNGRSYEGVIVNGQPIITSGEVRPKEPGARVAPGTPAASIASAPTGSVAWDASTGRWTAAGAAARGVQPPAPQEASVDPAAATRAKLDAVLAPLNEQVQQAAQRAAAAASSGDRNALALYVRELDAARERRKIEAIRQSSRSEADQYLAALQY